ncbi:DUF6879 family protein [Actinokineospora xionganensis]|uniref:DUF6879 family protein n=1 Tax=Actinokineospora xionganensis TaxID=2684470 RepID=UPI001C9C8867|nr:DUF6879 family protein [Actinokineospora xionganensis]
METQQVYSFPREIELLRRFLAGEPEPPIDAQLQGWHDLVRTSVAAGKTIGRVRAVRRPLTDYVRCQFAWAIPHNIAAGEDIRILDLTDDLDLPDQDFWLFDDTDVLELNFRKDGTLLDRQMSTGPDVSRYLRWRQIALDHAVPFEDYVRS